MVLQPISPCRTWLKSISLLSFYAECPHLLYTILRSADEGMKACTVLPDLFVNPKTAFSFTPEESPFSVAHNTKLSFFEWFNLPENEWRSTRFAMAMTGTANMEPPGSILKGRVIPFILKFIVMTCTWINFTIVGFQWHDLPEGAKIVDVGGGVGSSSMLILQENPHLNVIIQDRQSTIADAQLVMLSPPLSILSL